MISIIIPTYNERENIKILIPKIFEVLESNSLKGNLIIVDDSSPDGTALEVERLKNKYPVERLKNKYPIELIKRKSKLGIGSAYIAGFKKALEEGADIIFEMDADLSHDPAKIPEFIKSLENSDIVLGSRYINGGRVEGWNIWRKTVSKGANKIAKLLLSLEAMDITSGYRAYKSKVLKVINLKGINSSGYAFQVELLFKAKQHGFRIKEIPITFVDRRHGKSKLSKIEIINFFILCFGLCIKRFTDRLQ
ncbi:MAG TPA: polyprenol monophosphomannose synthase [Candidatus Altiarchaeales archaeon]|nr:polyprenol monophosphomannose synthase [Candidatus Altiarchaeales archaeon]